MKRTVQLFYRRLKQILLMPLLPLLLLALDYPKPNYGSELGSALEIEIASLGVGELGLGNWGQGHRYSRTVTIIRYNTL